MFRENSEAPLFHLEKILKKLAEYDMFINIEKCQFAMNFLGHLPTVYNLQRISEEFFLPKDAGHLRSFLGICSFYKKSSVPDYSYLVAPLFELLHKISKFIWRDDCDRKFELLNKENVKVTWVNLARFEETLYYSSER